MSAHQSYRPKRISQLIQQEISRLLITELPEMVGFLTVTGVEMPPDLKTARISISVLQKERREPVLRLLQKRGSYFRKILASRLNLRYNPELIFVLDTSVDYEERIDRLLDAIKDNEPEDKD